jgi:glycosyltransferase involved in cell wall biosynthesis
VFLFIGDGIMENTIKEFIRKYNAKNIIYAGKFPQEEQNIFLNACDISVISLNNDMYGLGVPSKSYYNMAASKPILYIGHNNSEIALSIKENNFGWIAEPANPLALAEKFDDICNQTNIFSEKGKISREICEKMYSESVILDKYLGVFK